MKEINISIKIYRVIILLFVCLIWATHPASSQNRSTITGYVFDQQRIPVLQIPVELMNELNSVIQRTKTDGSGRFFFGGLSGGRYSIRVLPLGTNLEEQTQEVELVNFGGLGRYTPDYAQKDFYLRLHRDGSQAPTITGAVFVQEIPEDARKMYEKAISDFDNKNLEGGILEMESAVKLFPTYYSALEKLGSIYISQQKYENARDIFSRAVAVNERSFSCWYGLGYVYYALKQSDAAVEAAQKAVSLNASSPEAHLFLGVSLRQNTQYEKAEKSLKQAEKLANGKFPDIYWNLALLYAHNLKRYKDAANALELFLKADPNNPNASNIKKLIKQFREASISN